MNIDDVRKDFPVLSNSVYLNTGGTGPISVKIAKEIQNIYEYARDYGPDTPKVKSDLENRMEETRSLSANLFNVPISTIAFTRAISEGMNIVAHGMDWVKQLRPVTYSWDKRSWYGTGVEGASDEFLGTPDGSKKASKIGAYVKIPVELNETYAKNGIERVRKYFKNLNFIF